ncbi:MAG: HAMP domain-containing histidine kinase [Alphaproteobacteria bacterium]|nr:HAMP domain-containing histidine kinase [Alphaproteobacteria bacterium]
MSADEDDAVRAAQLRAAAAEWSRATYLANLSHELRSPLNAILGFAEIISEQMLGPEANGEYRDFAADIAKSGKQLLALLNDVIDLSKLDVGRRELADSEIVLGDVVDEAIGLLAEQARTRHVRIRNDLDGAGPTLRAERRALKQILFNLLNNAIRFTRSDGKVTIGVVARPDGGIGLRVADTGIGIPADRMTTVFEPFRAGEPLTARTPRQGTGLGLAVSRALARLHGGDIELESRPGRGTTVTLCLPRQRVLDGKT